MRISAENSRNFRFFDVSTGEGPTSVYDRHRARRSSGVDIPVIAAADPKSEQRSHLSIKFRPKRLP